MEGRGSPTDPKLEFTQPKSSKSKLLNCGVFLCPVFAVKTNDIQGRATLAASQQRGMDITVPGALTAALKQNGHNLMYAQWGTSR